MPKAGSDQALKTAHRVARDYLKLGYEVVEQPRGDSLPPFLRGFKPDLIAVMDGDCVVIEIKHTESLRGSNELKELAAKVAEQEGWRFELISLGTRKDAASASLSDKSLEHLLAASLTAYDAGQRDLSLIYLVSVLDELVQDAAMQHRIKGRDRSARSVIQELAFQGIIDGTTADVLDQAWDRRNAIVHGRAEAESLSRDEVERIARACREVQTAMRLQAA